MALVPGPVQLRPDLGCVRKGPHRAPQLLGHRAFRGPALAGIIDQDLGKLGIGPLIQPGDRIYLFDEDDTRESLLQADIDRLRGQASFGSQEALVTVLGEVNHDGTYPMTPGMRASDLLCAAGGLSRKAYGVTAELSRLHYSTTGDNRTEHIELDSTALLRICDPC